MRQILIWLCAALALISVAPSGIGAETSADDPFEPARELFAEAVEDVGQTERAVSAFQTLEREQPRLAGRARVYLGALTAMQSKQTRWPHKKLGLLRKGLAIMDEGVATNPEDVETLFVHGVACRTAPRILRRRDDARRDFGRILNRLPSDLPQLDTEFVREILDFIVDEMDPSDADTRRVEEIRKRLPQPKPNEGSPVAEGVVSDD